MDRPSTDDDLVRRARDGDADAYGELVRDYQEVAFRTAFLITADAGDAEDATQDAFVKAHAALARFRLGEPFRAWLLTIVGNEARNRRKSSNRRRLLLAQAAFSHAAKGEAATNSSPEGILLSAERRRRLLAALAGLDRQDQEVIACRHLLDLSERESAAALGCRPGTVKSRLSRALARLRAELGEGC